MVEAIIFVRSPANMLGVNKILVRLIIKVRSYEVGEWLNN